MINPYPKIGKFPVKQGILNYTLTELEKILADEGLPKFRAEQIFIWLYRFGKTSFFEMTNIGKYLQNKLDQMFYIYRPQIAKISESKDGTIKFLLKMY